jgi:NADPH2:quinone reductase
MAGPITMKGAVTFAGPNVKIVDAVVPQPQPGQVVIKVAYSGCNPKDWYVKWWDNGAHVKETIDTSLVVI